MTNMYAGQDMMFNTFPSPANGLLFSPFAAPNLYGTAVGGAGASPGVHNGVGVMYDYTHTPNGGSQGGYTYGYHTDPSVASSYEYGGGFQSVSNQSSANEMVGYGSRGNVGMQNGGMARRDRDGSDIGSPHNPHTYDLHHHPQPQPQQPMTSDYEVHDNQLKAPVVVTTGTVVATLGSHRLFSKPPKPIVYGSRNVVRICDAFLESRCGAGERCHDIHVKPEYLASTRMEMSTWLLDREREFRSALEHIPGKTFRIFVADLKEVVEVPIESLVFTKGLYVDPTTRAKRARGAGSHAHVHSMMQVPTSCGLYSSDPQQCKWERWCNQVHIDHRWMQAKKAEFTHWFNELQTRYFALAPDDTFTVHDPQMKSSIVLPKFSIAGFSRGLFQGSTKKLASICLLFQRGRCTAGSCCNQIHVAPHYLRLVREVAALEQSPTANAAEKRRLEREMEVLRVPLLEKQQQEQREAEQAAAAEAAACSAAVDSTEKDTEKATAEARMAAEDDLDTSKALFEHMQVDEDAEPLSHPISANTSLTRRFNVSAPDNSFTGIRHINSDGSYSFNPYGSVTSLAEASSSYGGRISGARGAGYTGEGNGVVPYASGNVQMMTTNAKGMRRHVAVVSPEIFKVRADAQRCGDDAKASAATGEAGSATATPDHYGAATGAAASSGSGAYRSTAHQTALEGRRVDAPAHGEKSTSLHPLDFDTSLRFSPTPLLGFDASATSVQRNGSMRDDDIAAQAHLRLATSVSSCPYPGSSNSSQPHHLTAALPRGMVGNPGVIAKTRIHTNAVTSRTGTQHSATSPLETSPLHLHNSSSNSVSAVARAVATAERPSTSM